MALEGNGYWYRNLQAKPNPAPISSEIITLVCKQSQTILLLQEALLSVNYDALNRKVHLYMLMYAYNC